MQDHPPAPPGFELRGAEARDVPAIVGLIGELARFEKLQHLLQVTPERLLEHLFGTRPVAESVVAETDGVVIGFALFFTNFSTFLGQPGLYLEDLYVQPAHRGGGVGGALLQHLAGLANERGCGRFEWSVLDWNEPSIAFYRSLGARAMDEWTVHRLDGAALQLLAAGA
jgi:GNAT superfamily N-acetyltransferase